MKKIILLLFVTFFITGCNVSSNITINKDLSVKEEVLMTGTTEYFNNYYKSTPINVINTMLETGRRREILSKNGYNYYIDKNYTYPVVVATKEYKTINDFVNKTIFKEQYFSDLIYSKNENIITIKSGDFIRYSPDDIERYDISKFSLNIKIPYVAINNNADSYNPKTNTYTWEIDKDTLDKEIILEFDQNRIYIYNLIMYISIFVLIALIVTLIIIYRNIVVKNKVNNKIND